MFMLLFCCCPRPVLHHPPLGGDQAAGIGREPGGHRRGFAPSPPGRRRAARRKGRPGGAPGEARGGGGAGEEGGARQARRGAGEAQGLRFLLPLGQ